MIQISLIAMINMTALITLIALKSFYCSVYSANPICPDGPEISVFVTFNWCDLNIFL